MTTLPQSLEELRAQVQRDARFKYVFFWGHTPKTPGVLGRECLSQWFPAAFELDGVRFPTAEHYMMWSKARLFEDELTAAKILQASTPGEVKRLGREVKGFEESAWVERRFDVVVRGSTAKFSQNQALGEFLLSTAQRVLVEASPQDRVWGIGLGAEDPSAQDPLAWRGLNLLGFALMAARAELSQNLR